MENSINVIRKFNENAAVLHRSAAKYVVNMQHRLRSCKIFASQPPAGLMDIPDDL